MGVEVENLAIDGDESVERCFVCHILYIYTSSVDWNLREDLNSWYFSVHCTFQSAFSPKNGRSNCCCYAPKRVCP